MHIKEQGKNLDVYTPVFGARVALAFFVTIFALVHILPMPKNLTLLLLYRQDFLFFLVSLFIFYFALIGLKPRTAQFSDHTAYVVFLSLALFVITYFGRSYILSGYDLSRDEQMASFDTQIFSSGVLTAPLPPIWQDHLRVLNSEFIFRVPEQIGWVSAYLPMNSVLRAGVMTLFGDASLTGPILAVLGMLAIWGCARQIWPHNRENAFLAILFYATSPQVIFSAMSSYAMTAHLTLNLVWLWSFLKKKIYGDIFCLVIGFVATGLHQPHPHPLFAAPILFFLVWNREWLRASYFFVGYLIIAAFWINWQNIISSELVIGAHSNFNFSLSNYVDRMNDTFVFVDNRHPFNMIVNIFRFFAWQEVVLLPLVILGVSQIRTNQLVAGLSGGIAVTLLLMTAYVPYQGHGFGYRYLHGFIGSFILLSIFALEKMNHIRDMWRSLILRVAIMTTLVLIPIQSIANYKLYSQQARVDEKISMSQADYFIIGWRDATFSSDLVFNPPFLDRRPIRLIAEALTDELMNDICRSNPTVAIMDAELIKPIDEYFGSRNRDLIKRNEILSVKLISNGCVVLNQ